MGSGLADWRIRYCEAQEAIDESDFSAAHGPLALRFVPTQMLDMSLKPIKRSGMESWGDRRSV